MFSNINESEIAIHRLIVHKVDHKKYDAPVLADLETEVDDKIASFIRQHIRRNRQHKNVSTARYKSGRPHDTETVQKLGDNILSDPNLFVYNTQSIAQRLFAAQRRKNTSPGELVLCLYSDIQLGQGSGLAIMKMDPESGFVGRTQKVGEHVRIALEQVEDVLPSGELQKCAFVLPLSLRGEAGCDLLVLDQQSQDTGGNRQVATFFIDEFLFAERDLSSDDLTRGFLRHVDSWSQSQLRTGHWTSEQSDQFRLSAVDAVQTQKLLDIPAFATENLNDAELEKTFVEELSSKLSTIGRVTNLVFPPSQQIRNQLQKSRTYKGDFGLKVILPSNLNVGSDLIKQEYDPATNTFVITIRTSMWQEV